MKRFLAIAAAAALLLALVSCGSKNPTVRDTVKKKVSDNRTIGVEEFKKGNYSSARLFLEQALKDAYSVDSVEGMVSALQNLAEVHLKLGNFADASNAVFRARELNEREGLSEDFAVLLTIGKYFERINRTDLSLQFFEQALQTAKKDEDRALVQNSIGIVKIRQGLLDEAENWVRKSLAVNESKKIHNTLADNYFNLGEIYDKKGDTRNALSNYLLALRHDKISEKSDGIIEDLKRIGQMHQKLGDSPAAVYYYQRALNASEAMGYKSETEAIQQLIKDLRN